MVWNMALHPGAATLLALIPTTLDRVAVWGMLALVVALIVWREYTSPKVAPARPPSVAATRVPAPPALQETLAPVAVTDAPR